MDESVLKTAVGRLEDEAAFRAGAAEGRPLDEAKLRRARRSTIPCPEGRCFAKRPAGLNSPSTSRSSTEESLTRCWVQSARVSMWRSVPSPLRPQMPRVAVESVHTRRGTFQPKSPRKAWYPSPMPEALTTP